MILTERQKDILSLLITSEEGISVKELENRLNVSRRTIYREFKELKDVLATDELNLVNKKRKYGVEGNKEALNKLILAVKKTKIQSSMSVERRENALAAILLLNDEPKKIIQFALDLNVSEATIQNDLDIVEKSLAEYKINLIRKKGVGVYVEASESERRQVLVGILLSEINDYDFFHYLNHTQLKSHNFFLQIISRDLLFETRKALTKSIIPNIKLDSDHQLIELILIFAVSLTRIKAGFPIEKVDLEPGSLKYQGLVFRFMALITEKMALKVEQTDVTYLANKVMASDTEQTKLHYDSDYELAASIRVKNFVRIVSEKMQWNFQKSTTFVNRLIRHIIGLTQHRVTPLPNARIETLAGLSKRFTKLYTVIQQAWQAEFPTDKITSSEMQLLLLYFANEFTNFENHQQFNALVICENGIGTSAILKARLKQELPEIKQIKLSKVSDLVNIDLQKYDLILSTLELKGFSRSYQLVSPLLLDDEIIRIKNYLKDYERKYPLVNQPMFSSNKTKHATKELSKISIGTLFCADLVNSIKVQTLRYNATDLIAVVQECLAHIGRNLITTQLPVAKKILKRIQLAPVGIPNSHLALLHTSSHEIKRCTFMIFDLDNEIVLKSMDHNEIEVSRILLMLGPAELSDAEQEVMSLISSMIIMNDANLRLFTNGNQDQIKNAISSQYLQELKRKLE